MIGKNYCYQTGASATLFFEGRHFNPFITAGGSSDSSTTSTSTGISTAARTAFVGGYNIAGGFNTALPDRLSAGAARDAAMGQGVESGDREVVPDRDEHQLERQRDGEPLQLLRPRPDLSQRVRPAADAHDVRLHGERAQDRAGTPRDTVNEIAKSMNPTRLNAADGPHRAVDGRAVPEHAQHRRHDHGHQLRATAR